MEGGSFTALIDSSGDKISDKVRRQTGGLLSSSVRAVTLSDLVLVLRFPYWLVGDSLSQRAVEASASAADPSSRHVAMWGPPRVGTDQQLVPRLAEPHRLT